MKTKGRPNDIDLYVGARIREARQDKDISQEKAGKLLGISFQQLQKYEKGMNRIAAGRLAELSEILDKPISWFFPEEYGKPDRIIHKLESKIVGLSARLETISQIAKHRKSFNGHQGA